MKYILSLLLLLNHWVLLAQQPPITTIQIINEIKVGEFPAINRFEQYLRSSTHEFVLVNSFGWFERKVVSNEPWSPITGVVEAWQIDTTVYWTTCKRDAIQLASGVLGTAFNSRLYTTKNSFADSVLVRELIDTIQATVLEKLVTYHQLDSSIIYEIIETFPKKVNLSTNGGSSFQSLVNPNFGLLRLPVKTGGKYYGFNISGDSLLSSANPAFSSYNAMARPFISGDVYFLNDSFYIWDSDRYYAFKFGSTNGQFHLFGLSGVTSLERRKDGKFHLTTGSRVYKSSSLQGPYTELIPTIFNDTPYFLVKLEPSGWVIVLGGYGIQLSTNFGDTWSEWKYAGLPTTGLIELDVQSGIIFGSSGRLSHRLVTDNQWEPIVTSDGRFIQHPIISSQIGAITATVSPQGTLRVLTSNDLLQFDTCNVLSPDFYYLNFEQDLYWTSKISETKVFKYTDCSEVATFSVLPFERVVYAKSDTILVEGDLQQLYLVTSNGSSYIQLPNTPVFLDPFWDNFFISNDTVFLLGNNLDLWFSTDRGKSWKPKYEALSTLDSTEFVKYYIRKGVVYGQAYNYNDQTGQYEPSGFYLSKSPVDGWIKWESNEMPMLLSGMVMSDDTTYFSSVTTVYKAVSPELRAALSAQYSKSTFVGSDQSNWQIVPNPAHQYVQIIGPDNQRKAVVSILDFSGKTLIESEYSNGSPIETTSLPSGVYLVTVKTASEVLYRGKLVKI